jgi:hypothetical protein
MRDLDHPIITSAKTTDNWCARKGDLQRAFPLDVPMVPSYAIVVIADGERLTCGGFSLGKTVHLGNFKFIADYFGGLSLPRGGAMQAPLSWAQLTMGHQPRDGP